MGDMCFYYAWKYGDYYCQKKEERIPDDIYQRYCKNYSYDECPIYREEESGGCFLTSACVEAVGLPDDCHELTVLRRFRDTYLRGRPEGEMLIRKYYELAPGIVKRIKQKQDSKAIWEEIYQEIVRPCVFLIEKGRYKEALERYKNGTERLAGEV